MKTPKQLRDAQYRKDNATRIRTRKAQHRLDNPEIYRARNAKRDVVSRRATLAKSNAKARASKRALHLLRTARRRATQKNIPYGLDHRLAYYQNVIDKGVCEETGLPFDMVAQRGPFTPSLDRIKPELGYVRGNVRVVLWGLNCGFANFGEHIYAKIALAYLHRRNLVSQ